MEEWLDPMEQQQAAEERAREQELRLRGAVRVLGKSREGRSFLVWLLEESGVLRQDFPADTASTAWHAGRRALGLEVLSLCIKEGLAGQLFHEALQHEAGSLAGL